MLVYAIGNGPHQVPPTAYGEAFRKWKPPGLKSPTDNPFGWGPLASILINKIEKSASVQLMDACLLAAQHIKTYKWDRVVKPSFEIARKALGWIHPVTLEYVTINMYVVVRNCPDF